MTTSVSLGTIVCFTAESMCDTKYTNRGNNEHRSLHLWSPMSVTTTSEDGKELSTQCVLIVDFSGFSEIYPVRVIPWLPLSLLTNQFDRHLLHCERCMNKALYAIKNRILGHVCYNMLLAIIFFFWKIPMTFILSKICHL